MDPACDGFGDGIVGRGLAGAKLNAEDAGFVPDQKADSFAAQSPPFTEIGNAEMGLERCIAGQGSRLRPRGLGMNHL